jgi:DNA-binding NarL/FixJ family response regulator
VPAERFRVLVADDLADARFLAKATLEASGLFEVVGEAADGNEAIHMAERLQPDIVLLDLSMPRLDGVAALPALTGASPASKVVVFSSFSASRMESVVRSRGAVGYIQKSISQKHLVPQLIEVAGVMAAAQEALSQAGCTLAADLKSAREARAFVDEVLARWDAADTIDVVVLLVSELVTNAVVHAGSEVDLSVRLLPDVVRVEVVDTSPVIPSPQDADDHDTSGRGLAIMDAMASAWGIDPLPDGKRVWFEVPRLAPC